MPQDTTKHMETKEREPLPLQCSLTFLRCLKAQLNIWMLTFKATAQLFILDARGVWESCRWVQLPTSWPTSSPSSTACRASPSSWCTASLASRFGNNMGNGSKGSGNPKLSLRLSRFPAGPCLMTPNPSRYDHALLPEYFTN
nr:uncharacterized protein LOC106829108 isoform X2 [Equus asinus]